ncbi:hypothetical protein D3C80_1940570 [compost metagenome]
MVHCCIGITLAPVFHGLEQLAQQVPDHYRQQQCIECGDEHARHHGQCPSLGSQPLLMCFLGLAIQV